MKKKKSKTFHYICFGCAQEALKDNKPSGNRTCTMGEGVCDKCGNTVITAHVRDYGLNEKLQFIDCKPLD